MGVELENCIKMENGSLLCYDDDSKECYVFDKRKATNTNVPPKEWRRLALALGESI